LFTLALLLPAVCVGVVYGNFMRRVSKMISDTKASATEVAEEVFSNIRTVKAFANEDNETVSYYKKNEEVYNAEFQ
jgi:ATP-binding cassette subfamily B (MDR/TAP) protein 10